MTWNWNDETASFLLTNENGRAVVWQGVLDGQWYGYFDDRTPDMKGAEIYDFKAHRAGPYPTAEVAKIRIASTLAGANYNRRYQAKYARSGTSSLASVG